MNAEPISDTVTPARAPSHLARGFGSRDGPIWFSNSAFQTMLFKHSAGASQAPAGSRRDASEVCKNLPPGGRGECRVPSAPAASCAHGVVRMHTSIHSGGTGNHPAFPHAMVLTAYFVISPAIGLFCHRRPADEGFVRPG